MDKYAEAFDPGKPKLPGPIFVSKPGAYLGRLLALLTNIRLGWKVLPRINRLKHLSLASLV